MFHKILIAEDIDSINAGVLHSIKNYLPNTNIEHVSYCDDAHLRFLKEKKDGDSFDLLITDLSFEQDYRKQALGSGQMLIEKIREIDSHIPIIVYSVEARESVVNKLFNDLGVNCFVHKSRKGLKELNQAIECAFIKKKFISPEIAYKLRGTNVIELADFDLLLLEKLSDGLTQEQIALQFKAKNIVPSSVSSLEKKLNRLKVQFKASNTIHLVSIVKDLGLI